MNYTLDNGELSIGLTTAGGSFTSIKAQGREYLWQGDPAVWSGQAPICFPICGGLRDGRAMTRSGHEVRLARHGFARKQEWKLVEQTDTMIALKLESSSRAELLEQYPFPFKIVTRYSLEGKRVHVTYEVTNEAAKLCTAVPSTGLIDVENRSVNPMQGCDLPLTHELFDFAETIFDVLNSHVVDYVKKDEEKGLRLTFSDMPYLIVWGKPEGDFVAVEPWGGLSTCSDEDDVFEHKRGCLVAKPGETIARGFSIEIL